MHELTTTEVWVALIAAFMIIGALVLGSGHVFAWLSDYIKWTLHARRVQRDFERAHPIVNRRGE
jgi:hypothetical protein